MEYVEDCPLCQMKEEKNVASIGSRILYSTKNMYVAVDISPLCIGHLLIITKEHYFNFYELPQEMKEEAKLIMEKIRVLFQTVYRSETLFFEHGSLKTGKAGASVDHAHLHAIPFSYDMQDRLKQELGEPISCNIFSSSYTKDFSYLYVEMKDQCLLYPVDELPSQYLRKLFGEKMGNLEYDWRSYYLEKDSLERVEQTYSDLKGKIK